MEILSQGDIHGNGTLGVNNLIIELIDEAICIAHTEIYQPYYMRWPSY